MTQDLTPIADMFHVFSDTCHMASFSTFGGAWDDALSYRAAGMPATIQFRRNRVAVTTADKDNASAYIAALDSLRGYTKADLHAVADHLECPVYHARRTLEAAQEGDAEACAKVTAAGVQNYA